MPIIASTLLLVPVSWPKYFFVPALIIKCEFLVFSVMMLSQICRLVHSTQNDRLFVPGVIMAVYHASLVLGRFAVAGFTTRTDPSMLAVMIVVLIALWTFFMMAFSLSAVFMTKRGDTDSKDGGESPLDSYESAFVLFASDRSLTEREQRICWDYARGRTVEYIAKSCGISKETVKTHLKRVYAKSSCHSRQELIDAIEGYS